MQDAAVPERFWKVSTHSLLYFHVRPFAPHFTHQVGVPMNELQFSAPNADVGLVRLPVVW